MRIAAAAHNKLGFTGQLCAIRQTGRLLFENEQPPRAVIDYVANQLGLALRTYEIYARRTQTRFQHSRYLTNYPRLHLATRADRRAALLAAAEAAGSGDERNRLPLRSSPPSENAKRFCRLNIPLRKLNSPEFRIHHRVMISGCFRIQQAKTL